MNDSAEKKSIFPKIAMGCGGLLLVIALGVTLFCAFHVFIDPSGAISDDEALPGLIGGLLCVFVDIGLIVLGVVLNKKNSSPAAQPGGMAPGGPGAPPGGPGAAAGMQPGGYAAGPPQPKGPFPTHLLSGCASVLVLLLALGGIGFGIYMFDRAASARRFAEEDEREAMMGRRHYGLGPDFWRRREREREQQATYGIICGVLAFLIAGGGVVVTIVLRKKNKAKAAELAAAAGGGSPAMATPPAGTGAGSSSGGAPGAWPPQGGGPPAGMPPQGGGPPAGMPPQGGGAPPFSQG